MNRSWLSAAVGSLLALAALCAAGCRTVGGPKPKVYRNPNVGNLRRVVVVPFGVAESSRKASPIVTSAFTLQLQEKCPFQVILAPANDDRLAEQSEMWRNGRIDVDKLIEARSEYRADAFVFGLVTHYKPYDPPVLGLRIAMLSGNSGAVLWESEAVFDAGDKVLHDYFECRFEAGSQRDSLYGPKLVFVSPRVFAEYSAVEMVRTLTGEPPPSYLRIKWRFWES